MTTTRGRALSAAAPGPPPRPEAEPRSPAARPLPHSLLPMPPVNFCATWHQALAARHNGAGVRGSGGGLALPRDPPGRPGPAAPGPTSDAAVPSGRLGPVPAALRRPTCAGALGGRGALLGPEGPETGAGARHEGAEADEELRAAARAAPSGCARGRERGRVRTRGCAGWRRAEGAGAPRARVGGGGSVGAPGRSLQARRPSSPGRAAPTARGEALRRRRDTSERAPTGRDERRAPAQRWVERRAFSRTAATAVQLREEGRNTCPQSGGKASPLPTTREALRNPRLPSPFPGATPRGCERATGAGQPFASLPSPP